MVDALDTEGALLNDATWTAFYFRGAPAWHIGIFVIRHFPIEAAYIIRTCHLVVAAPDAAIIIHGHYAIRPYPGCTDRTYACARGFRAVLAGAVHIKIHANLGALRENDVPTHLVVGDIVCSLAGSNTICATNTFRQVDHHMPLVFR